MRPAPTSEPASGSVSTMVAPQKFFAQTPAHFFCSSVPRCQNTCEKPGPDEYMCTPGLAPRIISDIAQRRDEGVGVPPYSTGRSRLVQPPAL